MAEANLGKKTRAPPRQRILEALRRTGAVALVTPGVRRRKPSTGAGSSSRPTPGPQPCPILPPVSLVASALELAGAWSPQLGLLVLGDRALRRAARPWWWPTERAWLCAGQGLGADLLGGLGVAACSGCWAPMLEQLRQARLLNRLRRQWKGAHAHRAGRLLPQPVIVCRFSWARGWPRRRRPNGMLASCSPGLQCREHRQRLRGRHGAVRILRGAAAADRR